MPAALDELGLDRGEQVNGMHRRQTARSPTKRRTDGLDDDNVVVRHVVTQSEVTSRIFFCSASAAAGSGRRATLHGHELGHVAFDLDLAAHERLHGRLLVAVDEHVLGNVVGQRQLGRRALEQAGVERAAGDVQFLVALGAAGDDHVDLSAGGHHAAAAGFFGDLLDVFEPGVRQERVGHWFSLENELKPGPYPKVWW